jgi:hypothetical protein
MTTRRAVVAGFAGLGAALFAPLEAFAATWILLGQRTVNLLYDHDTIWVGAGAGLFTTIRLRVTGATVFMRSLTVTFANGQTIDIPIRFTFLPGSYSRNIDLPGPARFIRRIDFTYNRFPVGGSAVVSVWGRHV